MPPMVPRAHALGYGFIAPFGGWDHQRRMASRRNRQLPTIPAHTPNTDARLPSGSQLATIERVRDSALPSDAGTDIGGTNMGDQGKRDKGKKEQQKKAKLSPKEKRKAKREKKG